MLQSLHVKNLALIDEIEVEFKEGLNILTGETGAGKSIVLGSVSLALGARYSKDILRPGADYGYVEISFYIDREYQFRKLKELEICPEEGMVTLSRRLMPGRSICRINGETVSMALLKEAASVLIDIHGQHEHQSLLYKKNHLAIVDEYADRYISAAKARVKESYLSYRACEKEWEEAVMDEAQRAKELSFLQYEVSEIRRADLREQEDEELEEQYRRMLNGKKIAESVEAAHAYTSKGSENASDYLSRGLRALAEAAELDRKAGSLYNQLGEIDSLLNDFNRELSEYGKSCEFSDEEFYETESRLNEINHLKTKYGSRIEDILCYCRKQEERIAVLEDYDHYLTELKQRMQETRDRLSRDSEELSAIRKQQSAALEKEIEAGLKDLNFEKVEFGICFDRTKNFSAEGIDDIEFRISMNPGQPQKPLAEVASGGELSRIMLAIKAVMARKDEIETLIFDEIDVGISGRTAQKVSEKMALISLDHQVICITHLPQIAAMADCHFRIEKTTVEGMARTSIIPLDEQEMAEELARILGGAQITETIRNSAREMRRLAQETKSAQKSTV